MSEEVIKGGRREGAGRPRVVENPVTIGFRIEKEDKIKLMEKYGSSINDKFRKWVKTMIRSGERTAK